jgi:p-hydroxybenzoate 3-monooxygenase
VPRETKIADWSDDNIWEELKKRFPDHIAKTIQTGASIEKSITPIRSYIVEPLSYGRLFLAGDAAHILPPTGAKGLNLAVSDVFYLSRALIAFYNQGVESLLCAYSDTALKRIWSSMRIAQYMTDLLHRSPFNERAQESELLYLKSSAHAQAALAEQYAGMAF